MKKLIFVVLLVIIGGSISYYYFNNSIKNFIFWTQLKNTISKEEIKEIEILDNEFNLDTFNDEDKEAFVEVFKKASIVKNGDESKGVIRTIKPILNEDMDFTIMFYGTNIFSVRFYSETTFLFGDIFIESDELKEIVNKYPLN